jgi:hypothetical protein
MLAACSGGPTTDQREPAPRQAYLPEALARAASRAPAMGPATIRPGPSVSLDPTAPSYRAPHLTGGKVPFLLSGSFSPPTGATPGDVAYTQAVVVDAASSSPPTTAGTASFHVTIAGTTYGSTSAASIAGVFQDQGSGTSYLVISAFLEEPSPSGGADLGTVVHTLVKASDFAPGATVAFDGNDRLALFGHGPIDQREPQVTGAAVSGTVRFGGGTLAVGGAIDATVNAAFGAATWPTQTGTVSPPPNGNQGGMLPAGRYNLSYAGAQPVSCGGALAGHEASFSSLNPENLGLGPGPVTLTVASASDATLAGSVLVGDFGPSVSLGADPSAPPGTLEAVGMPPAQQLPTPDGTRAFSSLLLLDASGATAQQIQGDVGIAFSDAQQSGWCAVSFAIVLAP